MSEKLVEGREVEPHDLLAPADFKAEWRPGLTDEEYHGDRTALGSTSVRKALQSPNAFHFAHFVEKEQEEKKAFRYGRLIHLALLEGPKFRDRYVVEPEFWGFTQKGELSKQSKEAKEKRARWLLELPRDAVVVTEAERREITTMIGNVFRHDDGPYLLKDGAAEQAGYFRDEETGLRLKIKPDFLSFDASRMVDVKTSRETTKQRFGSSAAGYRYDVQLFMYAEGIKAITGRFPSTLSIVALSKAPPYECACYHLTMDQISQAEGDYRRALRRIREGIDSGRWPMAQQQMEALHTPYWFVTQTVEEEESGK